MNHIQYRSCQSSDVSRCLQIETSSYPSDEAATQTSLQYRQEYAAPYFVCAVTTAPLEDGVKTLENLPRTNSDVGSTNSLRETVIGFICSTRCHSFTHDSMTTHVSDGSILAIHSVVIDLPYRRRGIATQMLKQYIQTMSQLPTVNNSNNTRPSKIVLLAKAHLLSFYVNCGFQVM
jgi:ribosomal protein S18 acetylase RimI-like enzyme